jgi:hypothetical protein
MAMVATAALGSQVKAAIRVEELAAQGWGVEPVEWLAAAVEWEVVETTAEEVRAEVASTLRAVMDWLVLQLAAVAGQVTAATAARGSRMKVAVVV